MSSGELQPFLRQLWHISSAEMETSLPPVSFQNWAQRTSPIKSRTLSITKQSLKRHKKARDLEPVLRELFTFALTWADNKDAKLQSLKHHQAPLRYQGEALHAAWAIIRKSWVGLYPTSIISLKWVMMKVVLFQVGSLIAIIKSQAHKSHNVTLIIFLKMWVLKIIYAIKFYHIPQV